MIVGNHNGKDENCTISIMRYPTLSLNKFARVCVCVCVCVCFFFFFSFVFHFQCSAYTHVFADTIRSIAVLTASILAESIPNITAEEADASAAVAVSAVILIALLPLLLGLRRTWLELRAIRREEASELLHEQLMMMNSSSSSIIDGDGGASAAVDNDDDYRVTLA